MIALVAIYFVFADGHLDSFVTRLYFGGLDLSVVWPQEHSFWVRFCYKSASLLTALMGMSVIFGYLLSFFVGGLGKFRSLFLLMFLVIALGPGLFVNAVLKDHWGRPRPRETVEFGGEKIYQAPFVISDQGGKSFPCGHCSVVFALVGFAYWFGQTKRTLFWSLLLIALVAGFIMGMARVAVGAHYLSDVLVSGMVVWGTAWCLVRIFPSLLVVPEQEIEDVELSKFTKAVLVAGGTVVGLAMFLFALMSFPYASNDRLIIELEEFQTVEEDVVLKLIAGKDFEIEDPFYTVPADGVIQLDIESTGFGAPFSQILFRYEVEDDSLTSEIEVKLIQRKRGLFSELTSIVHSFEVGK